MAESVGFEPTVGVSSYDKLATPCVQLIYTANTTELIEQSWDIKGTVENNPRLVDHVN